MRKLVLVAVVVLSVNSFSIGHSDVPSAAISAIAGGPMGLLLGSRPNTLTEKQKAKLAEVASNCGPRPDATASATPAVPAIPYAQ